MLSPEQQKAYLEMIDHQTADLKVRIQALRERIAVMESQNQNTRAQSELLATMEDVIHSVEETRREAVRAFTTGESRAYARPLSDPSSVSEPSHVPEYH